MKQTDIMSSAANVTRYLKNLQGEVDSAALYRAMSERETDRNLAEVYRRLAAVEERHAESWNSRITAPSITSGVDRTCGRRCHIRPRAPSWRRGERLRSPRVALEAHFVARP